MFSIFYLNISECNKFNIFMLFNIFTKNTYVTKLYFKCIECIYNSI